MSDRPSTRTPPTPARPNRARPNPARPDPSFWGEDRPRRAGVDIRPGGALDLLRDRFQTWRTDARLGVLVLAVVAVVAGVLWYRIGVAGGDVPRRSAQASSATSTSSGTAGSAPTTTSVGRRGAEVIVHVAGAITHPGVVELAAGSRVIDAVEAAGGGLPDADLDRLNLAAKLVDGERVLVRRVGDPELAADGTTAVPGDAGAPAADGTTNVGLLNLNTATQAQLEELPGIGPALAGAILDERARRGSFRSVNELREVRGIGEKRFGDLRDKVTV